jgi:hypothetical protein
LETTEEANNWKRKNAEKIAGNKEWKLQKKEILEEKNG